LDKPPSRLNGCAAPIGGLDGSLSRCSRFSSPQRAERENSMPSKTFVTYRQFNVRECLYPQDDHGGRWYVEMVDATTGAPIHPGDWNHFDSMAKAFRRVDDFWATMLDKLK